jgi:hypothetical protein
MALLLLITAMVLCGLSFLLWLASHLIPVFRGQGDLIRFIARCLLTLGGLAYVAWAYVVFSGRPDKILFRSLAFVCLILCLWGRHLAGLFAGPLTTLFDGGGERIKPEPLYSIAEARRKQGRIHEAMWEIQAQLEKFPNDFRGQMLLAEIQAQNANDLPGAEATIRRLCAQKGRSPNQIAGALTTLGDWHLGVAQDVDSARAIFNEIIMRFPDTDLSRAAEVRAAHLADAATLLEQREPRTLQLKTAPNPMMQGPMPAPAPPEDPRQEAQRLVDHIDSFPHDTEAREELAKLYARGFGRLELASEQLEHLIALPNESPRHIVRWMNLLADIQVECTRETSLAAATLQRIIDRFPQATFADPARQRLAVIDLEVKRYEKSRVVKLGSSEKS